MKKNGFTLVELMITVGIVAILAAIAIPSYSAYVMRSNRTDATRTMVADAQALERCYSQTFTYLGCAPLPAAPATTVAGPSPQGYYTVTITVVGTPASYTITAVPLAAPQTADTACTQFTLDSTGAQGASPAGSTKTCWGST